MSGRPLKRSQSAPDCTLQKSTGFDSNFDEFTSLSPQLSLWKREKVSKHVKNYGRRILIIFSNRSSSTQEHGVETEEEKVNVEEEAVVSMA